MNSDRNKQYLVYLVLIVLVLGGLFYFLSKIIKPETRISLTMSEEAIFALADYKVSVSEEKIFEEMRLKFQEFGFMPCYRMAYQEILGRSIDRFERKFAYAASLLVLSDKPVNTRNSKKNALRLFIHFARLNLLDMNFAIRFQNFANKLIPAFNDPELNKLWENYLRKVFGKFAKPEIVQIGKIPEKLDEFLNLSKGLKMSAENLIKAKIATDSYQYTYELIPGKSGEEESDFVLKKVTTDR